MKLKDAIIQYKQEPDAISNSYEWYRKSALSQGEVCIGDVDLKVTKIGRDWHVDDKEFLSAINSHREGLERIKNNTEEHNKGIIKSKDGETVGTEWGHYTVHKDFRIEVNNYAAMKDGDTGTWYCNHCNRRAETEHKKEECHRCSDWNGCGDDCKLSKVYCKDCKKELNF